MEGSHPNKEEGVNHRDLFRGIPGFQDGGGPDLLKSSDDLMPILETNQLSKATEYAILIACLFITLLVLYWVGKAYLLRRQSKNDVKQILNINQKYKDLLDREESLQKDLTTVTENQRSLQFIIKVIVTIIMLCAIIAYRMGPGYLVSIVKEMPHLVTVPLFIMAALYVQLQRLGGQKEHYIKEQANLKPKMREQEKLLRETIDPKLYDTFRRIIMQDEQEQIEKMRKHDKGCTQKCRIKNSATEMDLDRNKALVQQLTSFNWCDICAGSSQSSLSPPSGRNKGHLPCTSACGMRLMRVCRPLMEQYGAQEDKIKQLLAKHEQMDQRDISRQKYKEQKEELRMQELQVKQDQDQNDSTQQNMREMLGVNDPSDSQRSYLQHQAELEARLVQQQRSVQQN